MSWRCSTSIAQLELLPGKRYDERAAVHRRYEAYLKNRMEVLRHRIHNQLIELAGDEARSRSYFDAVGPPTSSPS